MGASKYETAIVPNMDYIAALNRDGYTIKEIAEKLDITERTLTNYIKDHEDLRKLFSVNKEQVDLVNVVGSYFRMCTGYTVQEETRHYKVIDGVEQLVERYVKDKYIPPNPNCTENWIRARLKKNEVWGSFAEDTRKNIVASDMDAEEGGIVVVPAKTKAADEKIIEVKVNEVHE